MDGTVTQLPSVLNEPARLAIQPGLTISETIVASGIDPEFLDRLVVYNHGLRIKDFTATTREGDQLLVSVVPAGGDTGKQVLSAVAIIAIAVAAPYLATGLLTGGASFAGGAAYVSAGGSALLHAGVTAGLTMLGTMAVAALIPPPRANLSGLGGSASTGSRESQVYSLSGQSNTANLYGVVPRLYGEHRLFPNLASTPNVENVGQTSTLTALYDFGSGDYALSDIRIGELPASEFDPDMRIYRNNQDPDLKLVSRSVSYQQLSYTLEEDQAFTLRTNENAVRATVDLTFPSGLSRLDGSVRKSHSVSFRVEYRPVSGGSWKNVPASAFKGISSKDSASTVLTAEYGYGGGGSDDKGTHWRVWVHQSPSGKTNERVRLYRDGKEIYASGKYSVGGTPATITTGGKTYVRGNARDSWSGSDDSYQAYELLIPDKPDSNVVTVTAATTEPLVASVQIIFPNEDTWSIRITRTTPVSNASTTLIDSSIVTLLKSFTPGDILRLTTPHTMLEMQVVANDKLSGVVQNLSALAISNLRGCNNSGWTSKRLTGNNAYVALDILAGEATKNPLSNDQIDFPSFTALAAKCDARRDTTINGVLYKTKRYSFNGIFDADYTVKEAVDIVLAGANAALRIMDNGKIGVFIDEEQDIPRQMITPANSWNFSGARPFTQIPHALRVQFIDEDNDYNPAEVIAYQDGYSASSSTLYEDLRTFGITNVAEAWRYGRYMLAQGIHRSEIFTVDMDVENLVVQKGDLVAVQHDVPRFGGLTARVISVYGLEITLDRPFELSNIGDISRIGGYTVRLSDGTIRSGDITSYGSTDNTIVVDNATGIDVGNLFAFGEQETVTRDYLITSIEPGSDLTATLSMVRYVEELYNVDREPIPPWDPGFGPDIISGSSLVAVNVKAVQTWTYDGKIPVAVVTITWEIEGNIPSYSSSYVSVTIGNASTTQVAQVFEGRMTTTHIIPIDETEYWSDTLTYTITPLNSLGVPGTPGTTTINLSAYNLRPEPPRDLFLDVRGQELSIYWNYSISQDVVRYVIRYTPEVINPTWHGAQHLGRVAYDTNEFTTGARTGSYIVRSQNYSGVMSDPVIARTTIEELPDLNVIESINESPSWPGQKTNFQATSSISYIPVEELDGTVVTAVMPTGVSTNLVKRLNGTTVNVSKTASLGQKVLVTTEDWADSTGTAIYQFDTFVDLGAIYEAMLIDYSKAAVFTPAEFSAVALEAQRQVQLNLPIHEALAKAVSVSVLDQDVELEWDCWLEYSAIAELDFISSWGPLTTVDSMSLGASSWTPWRKIRVGYATGRMFRFRFVADAVDKGHRIMILDGPIELDMPDRVWRSTNHTIASGGTTINFNPAFRATPIIALTLEGAGNAVRYEVVSINRLAVTLKLINSSGSAVNGQVDIAALGYGRERSEAL